MRRILLALAVAALPTLAAAQTIGVVRDEDGQNFINRKMCEGSAGLELFWTVDPLGNNGFNASGNYRVFASNQRRTPASGDEDQRICFRPGDTGQTGLLAVEVTEFDARVATQTDTIAAADMQKLAAGVGLSCGSTASTPVYVCVLWFDANNVLRGFSNGEFTFTAATPPAPTNVRARPGERALNVSWSRDTSTSVDAADFRVEAVTSDVRDSTPNVPHRVTVSATSARVEGLVNDVPYQVTVIGISEAGNESGPSAAVVGTPRPTADFWEWYEDADGPEQGGCASGAAGALALVGAAALARLRRRTP